MEKEETAAAMKRLSKHVPAATNTRNDRTVGRCVFCAVHVLADTQYVDQAIIYP
jgi:hypothetical protein